MNASLDASLNAGANNGSQTVAPMRTGPSFAAALCGFLGSTAATTMVMFLLGSSV